MDLFQLIMTRKSTRAFLPEAPSAELIQEILGWAGRAPSAINIQPWEFVVVGGKDKKRLSDRLVQTHREKQVSCGPGTSQALPEPWIQRQRDLFSDMTRVVRDSPIPLGAAILEGSCRFYDAPLAILVCLDVLFPEARLLCVGMALGYLVLAAEAQGLGTCPIGLITAYEEEIREQLNIPENKRIVLGLAVGFPDPKASLNHFRSGRDDIRKMVRWIT